MSSPSRRDALALGVGVLSFAALSPPAHGRLRKTVELARAFREASREEVFSVAVSAIRGSAGRADVLGAIFLAGIQDVRPRPHGILHCVMEVEANFQLGDASSPVESWLPVFWNLDDFKRSQARDAAENGDWSLPAPPVVRFASAEAALRELRAATEAWDAERADRALVAWLHTTSPAHLEEMFEELLLLGLRCHAFIGHKAIYAVHVRSVLARLGWRHAQPALRSLVMTVLVERDTAEHERALTLAPRFPSDWESGTTDPDESASLMKQMSASTPAEAQELVVAALRDGLAPHSIWDAIRLLGSELFARRPGRTAAAGRNALLPVHAVTVPNALATAYTRTQLEETRRIALLQAAGWAARLRDALGDMVGLSMEGPGLLDREADSTAEDLPSLMARPTPERAEAWLRAEPGLIPAYEAALRSSLFRRGIEHHQHKYAAAVMEDARRVSPRWRSRLLSAGVDYLASPDDPETELFARSRRAIRAAGIG